MLREIWANKFVKWLLVILVFFAICWLAGVRFHAEAGEGGLDVGVSHKSK